ncbi:hypothetical protein WJX79_010185 [Trebouxia sp. C0005]
MAVPSLWPENIHIWPKQHAKGCSSATRRVRAHLGCRAVTQQVCARLLSHPEQEVLLILDNADDIIGSTG